jgi:hypothetical protein
VRAGRVADPTCGIDFAECAMSLQIRGGASGREWWKRKLQGP